MKVYLLIIPIIVFGLQSCKEVISKNITGQTPVLILPVTLDTISNNPVHFKWQTMEGATKYRLQIATPSFSNISDFVLDSIIIGTDFYFSLADSSQYELKLTALNSGYESQTLGPILFWVGTNVPVSTGNIAVPLLTPADSSYLNNTFDGNFTWGAISGGTNYQFRLVKGANFVDGTEIHTTSPSNSFETTVSDIKLPLLPGQYFWGVKAFIGSSEQLYAINTFYVDTVAPNQAVLNLPLDMASETAGSISFTWSFNQTNETFNSPVYSTIEVATDINFNSISNTSTGVMFSKDFTLTAGTYFWRVRNVDGAGNLSDVSLVRTFVIN